MRELPIVGGTPTGHLGRDCVAFPAGSDVVTSIAEIGLADGTIELDLAVSGQRSFPGLAWRLNGATYESFFVRPHQMGNPDAIQYTPVFNDVSAWQLYHGDGFWSPTRFPLNEWFTIRVAFAGDRGEAFVADMKWNLPRGRRACGDGLPQSIGHLWRNVGRCLGLGVAHPVAMGDRPSRPAHRTERH